jgi:hypothetical protein
MLFNHGYHVPKDDPEGATMQTLAKSPRFPFHGLSGPASQVGRELRETKDRHVVAVELEPGQQHLEPALLKALELIMNVLEEKFTKAQADQVRRIGDLLTESVEVSQAAVIEGKMRANAIRHLLEEGGWLNAGQIAEQGGYSKSNPAEPASRWKREGRIFAITFKGQDLYPAYQFDGNLQPRPVIAEVVTLFKHKDDPWKIAAWFASVNGWLRGKRPQDCLDEPERVAEAARQEISESNG